MKRAGTSCRAVYLAALVALAGCADDMEDVPDSIGTNAADVRPQAAPEVRAVAQFSARSLDSDAGPPAVDESAAAEALTGLPVQCRRSLADCLTEQRERLFRTGETCTCRGADPLCPRRPLDPLTPASITCAPSTGGGVATGPLGE